MLVMLSSSLLCIELDKNQRHVLTCSETNGFEICWPLVKLYLLMILVVLLNISLLLCFGVG